MDNGLLYNTSVLNRHMNYIINKRIAVCRKYKLTDTQFRIMCLLVINPKLKQKDIMKQLDLSRATITSVLKNMIAKNLLTKTKYNGKSYKLIISETARVDFNEFKDQFISYENLVTSNISKQDVETAVYVLKNAISKLSELNEVILK